jgi:hypothetical protein
MKITRTDIIVAYLALISGLSISAVAVYYSVAGLVSIFSAAVVPIVVMGVALEVSKLIATMWLKLNWQRAPVFIRTYMTVAVGILMIITSMGIFGFLSKAHSDQSLVSGDVMSKIAVYDDKIKTAKENIDANRKALKQMDEAVDQVMARSSSETGADKAVGLRRSQQKERARLQSDIQAEQKVITAVSEERAPIAAEVRKVEAEVGPIKYIAAFVYGDNPNTNVLEKAVTWVIIVIVAVFDPLAVILLLASQYSFQWFRKQDEAEGDSPVRIRETEQPTVAQSEGVQTDVKEIETVPDEEVLPVVAEATEQQEAPSDDATLLEPSVQPDTTMEAVGEPVILDMPGTIGGATIILPEDTVEEVVDEAVEEAVEEVVEEVAEDFDNIERPGDYITPPDDFAPPGTPGEAWSTPVHSEQQAAENLDKIYKASAEDIAKQKRSRGWFNVSYPKRDDTN